MGDIAVPSTALHRGDLASLLIGSPSFTCPTHPPSSVVGRLSTVGAAADRCDMARPRRAPTGNVDVDGHVDVDPDIVMAAQSAHDVVNQVRSVGDLSPSDDSASTINQPPAVGKGEQPPTSISSTAAAPNTITTTATTATTTIPATHETPSAPQMTDGAAEGSTASDEQAVSGRRPGGEEQLTGAPQSNQNAKGSEPERRDRAQALPTPQTNGEKFEGSDAGDSVAAPASADTSVGSDAEQARSEHPLSSTLSDADVKGHNRSNSVKKPASFKAVSVTKNFLAKAANGTVQPSKLGPDKG